MKKYFGLALLLITLLAACTKENELYSTASLSDYFPLKVGKQITYDLDSTVFINFGKKDTIIKYQVKDSVESQFTDNLGRTSYRIVRYMRKNASQPWTASNTFMATPTPTTIEFVENNLRYQKLTWPIKNGYTWKGNTFIDTYSLNSTTKYLDDWDYTYQDVNSPSTIGSFTFPNTLTVLGADITLGDPNASATAYASKIYSIEKYAKNVGLSYKEFLYWEYQASVVIHNCKLTSCVNNTCNTSAIDCNAEPRKCDSLMKITGNKIVCDTVTTSFYYNGYGVKLTITGHN